MKTGASLLALGLCGVMCVTGLTGCGEEEKKEETTQVAPPQPKPAPKPAVVSVDDLMAQMGIDNRISWPEELAVQNTEARRAVLSFFDAFARGDSTSVGMMLPSTDKYELEALVDNGHWDEATEGILMIDLRTGVDNIGEPVVMAVITAGDEFEMQPQLWHYHVMGSDARFEAEATPPNILDKITGADPIAAWYAELAREMELAGQPDEYVEIPQRKAFDEDESSSGAAPPQGPLGGPGGMPKPNKPTGPKRKPPRGPFSPD